MEKSEENKNLINLAKKLIGRELVTNEEFRAGLNDIINEFARHRSASKEINDETRAMLNLIVKQVNDEHTKILAEVKDETQPAKEAAKDLKLTLDKVNKLYKEILTMKPENGHTPVKGVDYFDGAPGEKGKDADEKKIIEEVLKKVPSSDEKIAELETNVDGKFVKVYEHIKKSINGFPGVRMLSGLMDVALSTPENHQALVFNSTTNRFQNRFVITVSDTAPSNPELNDLWLDIS
jgi:hypothetical protein